MSEPNDTEQIRTATEQKWAAFNNAVQRLFAERNTHPMDSPERTASAEKILALWYAEGS